jgi:polysaccharide export outer membrane protein
MAIDEKTRMKNLCFVNSSRLSTWGLAVSIVFSVAAQADAQTASASPAAQPAPAAVAPARTGGAAPAAIAGIVAPPGYVIGADDSLDVVFWREKEMSASVVVRPDGMISLPLINDVRAEGLTPEQLRVALTTAAAKFVEEPTVTVVVKQIQSRKVFITGQVGKPGPYLLNSPMTVLQLISVAGGVAEYADKERIVVLRTEDGKPVAKTFNYKEVMEGKKLQQNIELKPGDSVVVP